MRRFTLISLAVLAVFSIACNSGPAGAPTGQPTMVATTTPAAEGKPTPSPPASSISPTATSTALLAMPNVVGKNAAIAQDELVKAGFTNLQFVSDTGKLVLLLANWTVTKQTTKAGTKVTGDTLIVITCHKG